MANLAGFDANEVPEQQSFDALPKGIYPCIATESEMKPTKAGTGEYLQFTFEVLDGPGKGRKLWARMNMRNPNPTAQDIGQRELGAFCRAAGITRPNDSAELHNIPVLLHVDTELDDRNREGNVIKKYEPIGGAGEQQQQRSEPRAFGSARDAARDTANSYSPAAASKPAAAAAQPWKR
jgi:hypothetical protein